MATGQGARGPGTSASVGLGDITQLILDDHHEHRRLFSILKQVDRADTASLSAVWGRLAAFLEVHAAGEEASFYPELLRVGISARRKAGVEGETLDAIDDHNDIRDAVTEAAGTRSAVMPGRPPWPGRTRTTGTTWPRRSARG